VKESTFKVGDLVLRDDILRRGRLKKLETLWRGPYTILKKNSDMNYIIKMRRKSILTHANCLKLFIEN
jgi:hypothetical protein